MIQHVGNKTSVDWEHGELLLVDKPKDWTSFDVVARIRSMLHVPKVGHAGTLDPKATGLLLVCTGKMTKMMDSFSEMEKEYEGVMELGAATKSFDSETEVIERKDTSGITYEQLSDIFKSFVGHQKQVPPMFSAVKKNGRRLYKDARKGRDIVREPRDIFVREFEIRSYNAPFVQFRVSCSKGTYIRSLVNDIGIRLGCGAFLKELQRTRIGEFLLADAMSIEDIHRLHSKFQPMPMNV
jgi:tRNA pseudouridine55 synthase